MPRQPRFGPRYECQRKIGGGGSGDVFLVRDNHLDRDVALKLLHGRPAEERLRRFRNEFALLARLEHPGLAQAYDFGYAEERPFFTTQFVEGQVLHRLPVPLPSDEAIPCVRQLAETVAFLHSRDVLHLDLKPSNVILSSVRGAPILIDFGLFRCGLDSDTQQALEGTRPFMAPEYFESTPLGPWTDVYALGVTLYWLVTGTLPRHVPQDAESHVSMQWEPAPVPPSQLAESLPPELDHIVLKCLALDSRERFSTANELFAALSGGTRSTPQATVASVERTVGRTVELSILDEFLEPLIPGASADEAPPALVVTGPHGVGQSHLLHEAKLRAQTRGIHFYLAEGFGGRSTIPGALLRPLGNHVDQDAEKARSRWETFLTQLSRPRTATREDLPDGERRLRRSREITRILRSLRTPTVLAVDGLQYFDEVTVELVELLLGALLEYEFDERPPLRLLLALRQEGTTPGRWPALLARLLQPDQARWLTLGPLELHETIELTELLESRPVEPGIALTLFQETGGKPSDIVARSSGSAADNLEGGDDGSGAAPAPQPELSTDETSWLALLQVLDRPAGAVELSQILERKTTETRRVLAELESRRFVSRTSQNDWQLEPRGAQVAGRASADGEHRRLGRLAGRYLVDAAKSDGDPRLLEGVRHLHRAGSPQEFSAPGLRAARYLRSTHQTRSALALFTAVLNSLPGHRASARLDVVIELCTLHARLGEFDQGIQLVREALEEVRSQPKLSRLRLLLRLARLYAGRGDFRRAALHFDETLKSTEFAGVELPLDERLFFLNEYAAVQAILGEHRSARELCAEGLKLSSRRRSHAIREVVLNLLATRANIAMRNFEYPDAVADFEQALALAERIGSPVNQAVVLNNLGVAHLNTDRYTDAVHSFRDAERISARLDEGPSLVSTYGNLAVLYAKLGDFQAMEQVLERAGELTPSAMGRRQQGFLEHARGLCLVYRGRYARAREHLETSIALGKATGDALLVAFDEVFRAEALIFEGRYAMAEAELARLLASPASPRIERMILARQSFLQALCGDSVAAATSRRQYETVSEHRGVPFLQAWEQLFLDWSAALCGDAFEVDPDAKAFFERHGLKPAALLSRCVDAERALLRGDLELTRASLADTEPTGCALVDALWTLLRARTTLEQSSSPATRGACADLLASAAAHLIANPLPEWDARIRALQALLSPQPPEHSPGILRASLAEQLRPEQQTLYEGCEPWRIWTQRLDMAPVTTSGRPATHEGNPVQDVTTRALSKAPRHLPAAPVVRSRAMQRLAASLARIRESDLPVLIAGETGSGKELVAQWIHAEGRRAAEAFLVLDCATVPSGLLEAELFGARAGSFTDLREDQQGLLTRVNGGTILIDEVGRISLAVQAKLLRVLSEGRYRPLGTEKELPLDVRFLFSSALDLDRAVEEGTLREDFLHRLRVLSVTVPPLRERPEDLAELFERFLAETVSEPPELDPSVLEKLQSMPWPGNVRELKNLAARLAVESPRRITTRSLARALGATDTQTLFPKNLLAGGTLPDLKEQLERDFLRHHLRRLGGDTRALGEFLGLGRQQVYRRLRRLGISLRRLGISLRRPPKER